MSSKASAYITSQTTTRQGSLLLRALQSIINVAQDGANWSFAKNAVLSILKKLKRGQLIIESEGKEFVFGEPYTLTIDGVGSPLKGVIKVLDESFWTRLFMHPELGFADSYLLGKIEVKGLGDVFRIFVLNREALSDMNTFLTPIVSTMQWIANFRLSNTPLSSKSNISAHYDLSNDAFAAFLSWDMTYSCAIFDAEAKGCTGDLRESRPIAPPFSLDNPTRSIPPDDLERGQIEKLHLVARLAKIKQGSKVLDVGCGWGSFSILAAEKYGATVEAITLSEEQKVIAEARILAAGLSDRVTVHLMDYRAMPQSFYHAFDAVVSLGVMEHVGNKFMVEWFKKMSWAMKEEGAVKVFTMTTVPDTRWRREGGYELTFLAKYIFPGGELSSLNVLTDAMAKAGLNLESVEDITPHYARTLREWGYRFKRNFESHIRPGLKKKYPNVSDEDIEIYRRKYTYYFIYCEAGFHLRHVRESVGVVSREVLSALE